MSSDFKYYFGLVFAEIFELISMICSLNPESTLMDLSPHKSQLNPSNKSMRYLFKSLAKLCLGFIVDELS